jgi:SynChlorMet cassette radical SAM/SPASM protein ScmF
MIPQDVATPPLRSIYFYLTHECNQRCPHCWIDPRREGGFQSARPTLDQYLRLIDAAVPLGLDYVKLTGGEPLLRPEVRPLIEHAAAAGVYTNIETNAMLVTPEHADFFRRHRVQVSVSLDGATPEVHDRRRGLPGAFERTWKALQLLTESDVSLMVVVAASRSNLDQIPKILELLRGLKRRAPLNLKINPIVPMGRARKMGRNGETLTPAELLDLASWVTDDLVPAYRKHRIGVVLQLELAFFSIESLARGDARAGVGHCGFLNLISVLADGSLSFCGVGYAAPELTMGNIREEYDLAEIWERHPTLTGVRRKVYHELEGVCRSCLFHPICLGGCRAIALATGSSIAASPLWCQSLYESGLFPASRLRPPAEVPAA